MFLVFKLCRKENTTAAADHCSRREMSDVTPTNVV